MSVTFDTSSEKLWILPKGKENIVGWIMINFGEYHNVEYAIIFDSFWVFQDCEGVYADFFFKVNKKDELFISYIRMYFIDDNS